MSLLARGSIGNKSITYRTNKTGCHTITARAPKNPQTQPQIDWRSNFRAAQSIWKNLPKEVQKLWEHCKYNHPHASPQNQWQARLTGRQLFTRHYLWRKKRNLPPRYTPYYSQRLPIIWTTATIYDMD